MLELHHESQPVPITTDCATAYALAAAGTDFFYYQDLGVNRYDEQYWNPDCVLLFPATQRMYWFDLDHVSVSASPQGVRRYVPWNLWRKKFAFRSDANRLSLLTHSVVHVSSGPIEAMRPQTAVKVMYSPGERYRPLCECPADGRMNPEGMAALKAAWQARHKMKIRLTMEHGQIFWPVRLAFCQQGVYSFASKTVVVPDAAASDFSWETSSLGNLCVSSDGFCSIFRVRRTQTPIAWFFAAICPGMLARVHRLEEPSAHPGKERLRVLLRRVLHPVVRRLTPFELDYSRRTFTVFVREPS